MKYRFLTFHDGKFCHVIYKRGEIKDKGIYRNSSRIELKYVGLRSLDGKNLDHKLVGCGSEHLLSFHENDGRHIEPEREESHVEETEFAMTG